MEEKQRNLANEGMRDAVEILLLFETKVHRPKSRKIGGRLWNSLDSKNRVLLYYLFSPTCSALYESLSFLIMLENARRQLKLNDERRSKMTSRQTQMPRD